MNFNSLFNHIDSLNEAKLQSPAMPRLEVEVPEREDCSIVVAECNARDYSASQISHAVEDAGVMLTDLLTRPGADGCLRITLRVRTLNPVDVCASLDRYGYDVTATHSLRNTSDEAFHERLDALDAYLKI